MNDQSKTAMHVSRVSIIVNALLVAVKLAAGIAAHSGAMISDAIHSASDVLSSVIVMIGVRAAGKDSDREHPYGHERMESVAAIILAVILAVTGLFVGYSGVQKLVSSQSSVLAVPGAAALFAAILSIIVKELMYQYTKHYAKLIDSDALMADAWHHRSDALSSVAALVGIAGARLGHPILDPLAGIIICVFIIKAAVQIFHSAVDKMVDHSCDEETENAIRACILRHKDVKNIDVLRTREFGNRIYIELEIAVDGTIPLTDAHAVAQQVHDDVESGFPKVKHIMIHVNPA